jgi:hypothetical protein
MKEVISFAIQNNTNGTIPLSLFGNNADPMDNANATTQYSWNVTSLSITNENTIILQYRLPNTTSYSIVTTNFSGTSVQDVVNALNTLNLGAFFITTSGGNTLINNYNQNIVFNFLNILNPNTTSLNYAWNMSGAGGKADVYKNLIIQVSDVSPTTASGSISVIATDSILFNQTATSNPTTFQVYNLTTSTYLYNVTLAPSVGGGFTFTISANNSYFISAQD